MEKRDLKVIFCSKDLRLVPETREVMEHFKLVFGSGTSSPAKIRPLKVWDLLDFPLGSALWNFASASERAVILPLLLHFDVFRKNIFPLDVITLQGGTEECGPRCTRACFLERSTGFYLLVPTAIGRVLD